MSFCRKNGATGGSAKQRLNLSSQAYETIQNDIFSFGAVSLPRFINTIFSNYRSQADASISISLNHLQGKLHQLFAEIQPVDRSAVERCSRILIEQEKKRLIEKVATYEKGVQVTFSLNVENFFYLMEDSECAEEQYYGNHPSKYIKCVLEEYSRLPYVQRERIYFTSSFNEIEAAIQEKWQLRVETYSCNLYSIYPYTILTDPLCTANYLVGYSKRYGHPEDKLRPCSFRISALKSVRAEKSKSAFLKEERRKALTQMVVSRGVQFLSSNEEEICVRLTESGKIKYRRQMHMRPPFARRDGEDIFVFQCTLAQAEFYFFKFGADAEILSPEYLRATFSSRYKSAKSIYDSGTLVSEY